MKLGDIVVFNYPAGDTVALGHQEQDYYRMCYMHGEMMLPTEARPAQDAPYAEQQAYFAKVREVGRQLILQNGQEFGDIVYRPADRRENYVKRCVGLPGQTLQIKHNQIYLDGKKMFRPEKVQQAYYVHFTGGLTDDFLKEHGIRTRLRRKYPDGRNEIINSIRAGYVSYIINTRAITSGVHYDDGVAIRRCAVQNGVNMFTSLDTARILLDALEEVIPEISTINR